MTGLPSQLKLESSPLLFSVKTSFFNLPLGLRSEPSLISDPSPISSSTVIGVEREGPQPCKLLLLGFLPPSV